MAHQRKKTKRVPIAVAKRLARELGMSQVAIVAWDPDTGTTHVATYGESITDCEQAARLGNRIKRDVLKWPEDQCRAEPYRVKRRHAKKRAKLVDWLQDLNRKNEEVRQTQEVAQRLQKLKEIEAEARRKMGEIFDAGGLDGKWKKGDRARLSARCNEVARGRIVVLKKSEREGQWVAEYEGVSGPAAVCYVSGDYLERP